MTQTDAKLPGEINLCGTGYRVSQSEGLIVFTEAEPVWGCQTKITFQQKCKCWYVSILHYDDLAMAAHIAAAYKKIVEIYGENGHD
jgi:hypothetical protein